MQSRKRRQNNNETNTTAETYAEKKPKTKAKAKPATEFRRAGKASNTDKYDNSGSGEENTKNTTKRKAKGKEDADTDAGEHFASSDHSASTGAESGKSCGTD